MRSTNAMELLLSEDNTLGMRRLAWLGCWMRMKQLLKHLGDVKKFDMYSNGENGVFRLKLSWENVNHTTLDSSKILTMCEHVSTYYRVLNETRK